MIPTPAGYPADESLTPVQTAINQWLHKLAAVEQDYSAKWGVGRLPLLTTQATSEKWTRHVAKLTAAIIAEDLYTVEDLAQGTVRAWAAMDREATQEGYTPQPPDILQVRSDLTGTVYRIYTGPRPHPQPGVIDEPLECVARILDAAQLVNQKTSLEPQTKRPPDVVVDEKIPF